MRLVRSHARSTSKTMLFDAFRTDRKDSTGPSSLDARVGGVAWRRDDGIRWALVWGLGLVALLGPAGATRGLADHLRPPQSVSSPKGGVAPSGPAGPASGASVNIVAAFSRSRDVPHVGPHGPLPEVTADMAALSLMTVGPSETKAGTGPPPTVALAEALDRLDSGPRNQPSDLIATLRPANGTTVGGNATWPGATRFLSEAWPWLIPGTLAVIIALAGGVWAFEVGHAPPLDATPVTHQAAAQFLIPRVPRPRADRGPWLGRTLRGLRSGLTWARPDARQRGGKPVLELLHAQASASSQGPALALPNPRRTQGQTSERPTGGDSAWRVVITPPVSSPQQEEDGEDHWDMGQELQAWRDEAALLAPALIRTAAEMRGKGAPPDPRVINALIRVYRRFTTMRDAIQLDAEYLGIDPGRADLADTSGLSRLVERTEVLGRERDRLGPVSLAANSVLDRLLGYQHLGPGPCEAWEECLEQAHRLRSDLAAARPHEVPELVERTRRFADLVRLIETRERGDETALGPFHLAVAQGLGPVVAAAVLRGRIGRPMLLPPGKATA